MSHELKPYDPTPGQEIVGELRRGGFDASWVAPRLYMGSIPTNPSQMSRALAMPTPQQPVRLKRYGIDHLALCAYELQPKDEAYPDVVVHRISLDDSLSPLRPDELQELMHLVEGLHGAWAAGERLLVTCAQGRNRSGLVCGLLMRMMGYTPAQALHDIRVARQPKGALSNTLFEHYIVQAKVKF